jgi:hypothetical protein
MVWGVRQSIDIRIHSVIFSLDTWSSPALKRTAPANSGWRKRRRAPPVAASWPGRSGRAPLRVGVCVCVRVCARACMCRIVRDLAIGGSVRRLAARGAVARPTHSHTHTHTTTTRTIAEAARQRPRQRQPRAVVQRQDAALQGLLERRPWLTRPLVAAPAAAAAAAARRPVPPLVATALLQGHAPAAAGPGRQCAAILSDGGGRGREQKQEQEEGGGDGRQSARRGPRSYWARWWLLHSYAASVPSELCACVFVFVFSRSGGGCVCVRKTTTRDWAMSDECLRRMGRR